MIDRIFPVRRRIALLLGALLASAAVPAGAVSPVEVNDAWTKPATGSAAVYATIVNTGDDADRLTGVMTPSATSADLHDATHGMTAVPAIVIPPHATVTLSASGAYVQLNGLKSAVQDGDALLMRWHFEHAGWVVAIVRARTI